MASRKAQSHPTHYAAVLLYTAGRDGIRVLLAHPSGRRRNSWIIPRVEERADDHMHDAATDAARAVGITSPLKLSFLGSTLFGAGKKRLHVYIGQVPKASKARAVANDYDDAQFFDVSEAKQVLDKQQEQFLQSLKSTLMFLGKIA